MTLGRILLVYFLCCIYTDGFNDWFKSPQQLKLNAVVLNTMDGNQNDNSDFFLFLKIWGSIGAIAFTECCSIFQPCMGSGTLNFICFISFLYSKKYPFLWIFILQLLVMHWNPYAEVLFVLSQHDHISFHTKGKDA